MQLTGNTILITGGTSGIGLAFAEEFLKEKNIVIICGRRGDRLKKIKDKHPDIVTKICDVKMAAERETLFNQVVKEYPDVNVLINNAGIQLTNDFTKPVNPDRLKEELEINFIAPLHLASLFVSHLKTKRDSAIINISSGLAFVPIAFMPVYCASKAALHSATLSLRHQLIKTSIKVFEIAPPAVDTELGHDRRMDKTQSHGGIPVSEFIKEAMDGIKNDVLETAVGLAKGLRSKREEAFEMLNKQF
jgi:uncharacterized oxidoreductase